MSGTTSENDDLILNYEYVIAGVVILLFGLLYWFLNNTSSPTIFSNTTSALTSVPTPKAEGKIPRQGYPISPVKTTAISAGSAGLVNTVATPSISDNTKLLANSSIETPEKNALVDTTITQEEDSQSQVADTEITEPITEDSLDQTQSEDASEISSENTTEATEADNSKDPVIAKSTTDTKISNPDSGNTDDNTSNATDNVVPTYSLPDGSIVKISSNGFEGDLQQLFQNGVLNKPLTYDQIFFDTGSTKLNTKSDRQIKVTAALMNAFPKTNILLRGHTDNRGSATDNFQLSLARANSMGLALGALGIDTERIRVLGMGDGFPIASNNTEEGRKKNRRIEILLQ